MIGEWARWWMRLNLAHLESIRKGTRMIDPGAKKVSFRCHEHRHDRCRGDLGEPFLKCECPCHEGKNEQERND